MTDKNRKRELAAQYRQRNLVGGVYIMRNTRTGRILLDWDGDLQGSKNRFSFMQATDSPPSMKLRQDWERYGKSAFEFEVLDEVKMQPTQSSEEFYEELKTLSELWREKLSDCDFY